jgi:hypothetical protein
MFHALPQEAPLVVTRIQWDFEVVTARSTRDEKVAAREPSMLAQHVIATPSPFRATGSS